MADIPDRLAGAIGVHTDASRKPAEGRNDRAGDATAVLESLGLESGTEGSSGGPSGAGRGSDAATDTEPLSLDIAFEILKNGRRRRVLEELSAATGDLTTGELSERIAAWENSKPIEEITSEERKRVYVGLYQCHLPKMHDADVVVFNKDRGLVAPGEHADLLDRFLTPADPEPSPTSEEGSGMYRWVGTTVLAAGLLGLSLAAETVSGVPTATFGLAVLLVVSGTICLGEARSEWT
ncbi:DUF7344 domain-containing protein [Haloglomus litoreum]|uniref:DUF7344 domain-containing protein n=1 Tax=Haloglomus litoreum TaxID=3034026 RepID=UPI0023E852AB|nr:hypothetical protein [Haloglomus sp. DT116]